MLGKSEKAQQKVVPGSWQHAMLAENISALRIALTLLGGPGAESNAATRDELAVALQALDSMIGRVATTEMKFAVGTPQHSLQRNRLKALRIARAAVNLQLSR